VGDDVGATRWFSVGDNLASRAGHLLWFAATERRAERAVSHPLVELFIVGSEAYHVYYR
jgi:hypothetical protein